MPVALPRRTRFGLGFGPTERRGFKTAAAGGSLAEFFSDRPAALELFEQRLTGTGPRGRRARAFAEAGGPLHLPAGPPGVTGPEATQPGLDVPPAQWEDILRTFGGTPGPYFGATSDAVSRRLASLGTGSDSPEFDKMMNDYLAVANREANRQSARVTESFGATGSRYSQDLLNAQRDTRQRMMEDITSKANEIQLGLRKTRTDEEANLLSQGTALAGIEAQYRNPAAQRMFLDAIRAGAPPDLLRLFASIFGTYSPDTATTVV